MTLERRHYRWTSSYFSVKQRRERAVFVINNIALRGYPLNMFASAIFDRCVFERISTTKCCWSFIVVISGPNWNDCRSWREVVESEVLVSASVWPWSNNSRITWELIVGVSDYQAVSQDHRVSVSGVVSYFELCAASAMVYQYELRE